MEPMKESFSTDLCMINAVNSLTLTIGSMWVPLNLDKCTVKAPYLVQEVTQSKENGFEVAMWPL